MAISAINLHSILPPVAPATSAAETAGNFGSVFSSAVNQVNASGQAADAAAQNFLSGNGGELHSTILASQSADLDFELFLQVKNKVVSAYEDIMRMQV